MAVMNMIINDELLKKNMSKYRLSKESGVPQTTITDICCEKVDLEKCAAGTLYRIAKVLNITIEDILESNSNEYRSDFETFKSNTCHYVKDKGDLDFIIETLQSNSIRTLYQKKWYPEAFYLLGMVDYLSRINDIPLCDNYNDMRTQKLNKPIYPLGVSTFCNVTNTSASYEQAKKQSIPEFSRFNIFESEIRDIV